MKKKRQRSVHKLMTLMKMNSEELKVNLYLTLKKFYKNVYIRDGFIMAVGYDPVCFIAHMDTVWNKPINPVYDSENDVIYSECGDRGIGADDRAGIFAIIELLRRGYRPCILFLEDEEIGGIGAEKLIKVFPNSTIEIKYMIELDRKDFDDCVFYSCDNPEFIKYIESFGFKKAYGTFTDISIIAPAWGIAAVNLSIGYKFEHTPREILFVDKMYETIDKCENIIKNASKAKSYQYIKEQRIFYNYDRMICACCDQPILISMARTAFIDNQMYIFCPTCYKLINEE